MATAEAPYRYWRPSPPPPSKADVERFWGYVLIGAPDECWPWRTLKRGAFWWRVKGVRYKELASRLAFRISRGRDLGPREVVAHRCDWRPCCNPDHLEAKTQRENSQDAVDRGMHPYMRSGRYRYTRRGLRKSGASGPGEANGYHRLTDDAVRAIRARYVRGVVRQADLAAEFGISASTVGRVIRHDGWTHIPAGAAAAATAGAPTT